jgi:hypothetical protein
MKLAGISLFVVALINTLLLTYGFRDFSLQLTAMFFITIFGLPLGSYLAFVNISMPIRSEEKSKPLKHNFNEDECDVVGKFVI